MCGDSAVLVENLLQATPIGMQFALVDCLPILYLLLTYFVIKTLAFQREPQVSL